MGKTLESKKANEVNELFVTLKDGTIRNTYDLRLRNKSGQEETYLVTLTSEEHLTLHLEGAADTQVTVPANETLQQRVYIEAAPDSDAATEALSLRTAARVFGMNSLERPRHSGRVYFDPTKCSLWKAR